MEEQLDMVGYCVKCRTKMDCIDDINYDTVRIDYYQCPNCKSQETVQYNPHSMELIKLEWVENR